MHLGFASYFHRFFAVFSFLNLPARLAGTRQRRVFVESHSAVPLAFRHKMAGCARKSHIFTEFLLLFYFFIWYTGY